MKLLSLFGSALFVPALRGIAKHVHAPFVSPIERLNVLLYVAAQAAAAVLCLLGALDSVGDAVKGLRAAAVRQAELPSYFGVEPEWMCVEPTVPAAKLSSQGGVLKPGRPYVSFGEAGGPSRCGTSRRARQCRCQPSRYALYRRPTGGSGAPSRTRAFRRGTEPCRGRSRSSAKLVPSSVSQRLLSLTRSL
ncbi:hypothetical protein GCM10017778_39270 [Streptomyces vinaceus]|nr:hypothetical protein GCM10017778_39270 [Streptomyces vinaceus]